MSSNPAESFSELALVAERDPATFRLVKTADRLRAIRTFQQQEWERIESSHRGGASGRDVLNQMTALADELVLGIVRFGLAEANCSPKLRRRIAVCALGGYARGEMSPHSDLDICLIYKGRLAGDVKALNEYLVPLLWDVGFKSGYVLQQIDEAVNLAASDPEVLTSYMQARLLFGSPAVFTRLETGLQRVIERQKPKLLEFLHGRIEAGAPPAIGLDLHAPEPDVKENVGGLRDFHVANWIMRLVRGALTLDDLESLGELPSEENLKFQEGLDFLWRIRNELHFHFRKGENRLTFAHQKHVASAFGYGAGTQQAIDRFMMDYYTAARAVRRLLQFVVGQTSPQPAARRDRPEPERGRIEVHDGVLHIGTRDPQWFAENPPRLMEIFWECGRRNARLDHDSQEAIRQNLGLVGDAFRRNDLVRRFFVALCGRPLQAGPALRQAAETGLLGAYIPEFSEVDGVVRYEDFHSFPVDEHTLRAVEALAAIPDMEEPTGRLLRRTLEHLHDPHVLVIAILLHDLGKAGGEEHVEEGVRLARTICERIGLAEVDAERIMFLVEHHMAMNHIAMYRDTDDLDVISGFAATMRTTDRLGALLLHSYADLSAVGPNVWTEWKGALLSKLYLKTERVLSGRAHAGEAYWTLPKAEAVVEAAPPSLKRSVIDHLREMGERYFIAFSPAQIVDHMACMDEALDSGLAVRRIHDPETATTDIVICVQDSHGLFAKIAGSLASQLMDVQRALVFTAPNGYVVDRFTVSDAVNRRSLTERQFELLKAVLYHVLVERGSVQEYVNKSKSRLFALHQPRVPVPTRIAFDNDASRHDTVIDIETGDRTGLLYDIACVLAEHGISFFSSYVVTDARQVRDSFYVRLGDSKITDPALQVAVRSSLQDAIRPVAVADV